MRQYMVDAFTDKVFAGNQAAVCVLEQWLPEELMQNIACENKFAETAFVVRERERCRIRWFTPGGEIDLCGHATLAAGYVLLRFYEPEARRVELDSLSGILTVERKGDLYELDFPAYQLRPVPVTSEMTAALGVEPEAAYLGRDLVCYFSDEQIVRGMRPDFERVCGLEGLLLHVTAPGTEVDCVSRSFGPKLDVLEDSVCGSGHCHIAVLHAKQLGKNQLVAYQASQRGGMLHCTVAGDRVRLAGTAVLFAVSELLPDGWQ